MAYRLQYRNVRKLFYVSTTNIMIFVLETVRQQFLPDVNSQSVTNSL